MPERFTGRSLPAVMDRIRDVLGEDALILRTSARPGGGPESVEIVAAGPTEVEALRERLRGRGGGRPRADATGDPHGAYRIAWVGPAAAGKTTALLKLALASERTRRGGGRRLGILLVEGGRRSSLEEVRGCADLAGIPVEVAETPSEVPLAMASLSECDVVLVDTPGRPWGGAGSRCAWDESLARVRPHEVHLVLPAGLRPEVAGRAVESLSGLRPTHALLTQVDALPGGRGLPEFALGLDLPIRWLSDAPDPFVPLRPAVERIVASMATGGRDAPLLRRVG